MRRRTFLAVAVLGGCVAALTGCAVVFAKKPTPESIAGTYTFDPASTLVPPMREFSLILAEDGTMAAADFPANALGNYAEGTVFTFEGTWHLLDRETPISSYHIEFSAMLPEREHPREFTGKLSLGDDPRSIHFWIDPDGTQILDVVRSG